MNTQFQRSMPLPTITNCAVALASRNVFGLGGEYANGQTLNQPAWPAGMKDLVNAKQRIGGMFVDAEDIFFYSGTAPELSAFLDGYAKIQNIERHRLILHRGAGSLVSGNGRPCDWKLQGRPGAGTRLISTSPPARCSRSSCRGWRADTQFEFAGAARPERTGSDFTSYLPSDGTVKLSWKEARPEAEGKLFYAAEMLSQISVSPGLMRQVALLDFKVMQGELNRVTLLLRGAGEVTRVQGDQVLSWNVEPGPRTPPTAGWSSSSTSRRRTSSRSRCRCRRRSARSRRRRMRCSCGPRARRALPAISAS
jgi:hypothetical protein